MEYKPTIGLEIHAELNTKSKMFCSCKNNPQEENPNINVCPVCMGHPGTLPVINKEAVKKVIKTGLALNCDVNEESGFDRKNYFYPDLPKGYQISQYKVPICKKGFLKINDKEIGVRRIHLEEDTGKLTHSDTNDDNNDTKPYSLVDFNRAGIPLMELVTEPEMTSAEEARKFAEELQLILRYLGVSNADMERGEMRCEANISIAPGNQKELGVKVEIKNLNSFKAVQRGIEYEIKRQEKRLQEKEKVEQETRGWDADKEKTFSQRIKEEEHDYRYFPEPDLPPLKLSSLIREVSKEIPELPSHRRKRFQEEYNLKESRIEILVGRKKLGEYFEKVISELEEWVKSMENKGELDQEKRKELIKLASNYLLTDLLGLLTKNSMEDLLITPENFAELITLIYKDKVSSKTAKKVLEEMFNTGGDPSQIVEEKGLEQISDTGEIEKIIEEVISDNQEAAVDYKKGKEEALQFLLGKVMQATKGKADPELAKETLKRNLN